MDRDLDCVHFDVSGQRYSILKDKLTSGPSSKLKSLYYSKKSQQPIYIDRAPCAFSTILAWYQTGELHIPVSLCPGAFLKELDFWGIKHTYLTSCCFYRLKCFLDEQETIRKFQKAVSDDDSSPTSKIYHHANQRNFRSRVWPIVDYRENTCLATAYFIMTVLMILLSIFVPAYMTDPMFQRSMTNCERLRIMKHSNMEDTDLVEPYLRDCSDVLPFINVTTVNPSIEAKDNQNSCSQMDTITTSTSTRCKFVNDSSVLFVMIKVNNSLNTDNTERSGNVKDTWKVVQIPNTRLPVRILVMLETVSAFFFLFDFAIRIVSCPNIVHYFKSAINVTDAVSLIGIVVHTIMLQFYSHTRHHDIWVVALEYLQMLRVFRLFRIVKNVKASRVLVYSVFQNIKDLAVLGLFLAVGTCLFASILYVCEDNTTISSIPVGWYWALVTMTTVGYGDVTPKTTFGRFFACLCATSGVLLFTLTVPIFTGHFITLYQYSEISYFREDDEVVPDEDIHTDNSDSNLANGLEDAGEMNKSNMDKTNDYSHYSALKIEPNSNNIERFV